jgi:hypothetical protein
LEAGNILIHFTEIKHLKVFLDYLESIDTCHYKAANSGKGLAHDIYLPVGNTSVNMAFSVDEFEELRQTVRRFWEKESGSPPQKAGFNAVFLCNNNYELRVTNYEFHNS